MSAESLDSSVEAQLRRACAILDRRVRSTGAPCAEEVLREFPQLATAADIAVELIYTEFVAREQRGPSPLPDEYYRRFPQWRAELAAQFQVHEFLSDGPKDRTALPAAPGQLGPYDLLEKIGAGAASEVYRAWHRGLNRPAAIKIIVPDPAAGPEAARDFGARIAKQYSAEAELVARLAHPGIVQIYEVGDCDGRPYLVLEYVDGGSLADKLRGEPQPPREAVVLVETLARAVAHAHRQGVLHCDLKPANVLLSAEKGAPSRARPAPKITDFSLARRIDGAAPEGIAGTPSYMAPEQAVCDRIIGPGVDVWGLGAVFYEALTGRPPFRADTALNTLMQVVSTDPVPPQQLQPGVPADLATICLKCLEKDPRRRYATADELADDLRRFLDGEPIRARPAGAVERAWKWCRRRPAVAGLLAFSAIALLTLLLGSLWTNAQLSQAASEDRRLKREALEQLETTRRLLYTLQLAEVEGLCHSDPGRALTLLEDAQVCRPELRDFAWGMFYQMCRQDVRTLRGPATEVRALTCSADGKFLAAGGGGAVLIWDPTSGEPRGRIESPGDNVTALVFAPKGPLLALGSSAGSVRLWNSTNARSHDRRVLPTGGIAALRFAPDGETLAVLGTDHRARILDTATLAERSILAGDANLVAIDFNPTSGTIATADEDMSIRLFDAATGTETRSRKLEGKEPLTAIAFAPDGKWLAVAGTTRHTIALLRADTLEPRGSFKAHWHATHGLAWSPDGRSLATASRDRTVKVWDAQTFAERACFKGHTALVRAVSFTRDGQALVSAGDDGTVRLWSLPPMQPADPRPAPTRKIVCLAYATDGKQLVVGRDDGTVLVHSPPGSIKPTELKCQDEAVLCLALAGNGLLLVTGGEAGTLRLWDLPGGRRLADLPGHRGRIRAVTFSPDGRWIASAGEDGIARLWDVERRSLAAGLDARRGAVRSVGFHPDGNLLAVGNDDGSASLWDVDARREVAQLEVGNKPLLVTLFSPDGKTLACGGLDYLVSLWDVPTRTRRSLLRGHSEFVFCAAYTPDGRTLATGSGNRFADIPGEVRLWDVNTGHARATLTGQTGPIAFAPDGQKLATVDHYTSVRFWLSSATDASAKRR